MLSTKSHTDFRPRWRVEGLLGILLCLAGVSSLLTSCGQSDQSPVVASVYSHELRASDLEGLVGEGVSPEDSAAIVSAYIEQWIRQTVVLVKAEKNVTEDFTAQLNEYRNSLITYAYERQIIDQLLDTSVSADEIAEYYAEHRGEFLLKSGIVKAVYVTAPRRSPAEAALKRLVSSSRFGDAEVVEMEQVASRHGLQGYYDIDTWMPFYSFQAAVPVITYNENLFLRQNRSIVFSDDSTSYFARIVDYKVTDEVAPLEMQQSAIRAIILNHRKVDILSKMQADLMAEAEKGGHISLARSSYPTDRGGDSVQ